MPSDKTRCRQNVVGQNLSWLHFVCDSLFLGIFSWCIMSANQLDRVSNCPLNFKRKLYCIYLPFIGQFSRRTKSVDEWVWDNIIKSDLFDSHITPLFTRRIWLFNQKNHRLPKAIKISCQYDNIDTDSQTGTFHPSRIAKATWLSRLSFFLWELSTSFQISGYTSNLSKM